MRYNKKLPVSQHLFFDIITSNKCLCLQISERKSPLPTRHKANRELNSGCKIASISFTLNHAVQEQHATEHHLTFTAPILIQARLIRLRSAFLTSLWEASTESPHHSKTKLSPGSHQLPFLEGVRVSITHSCIVSLF